jgi:uncharacterized membrane-anchored protein
MRLQFIAVLAAVWPLSMGAPASALAADYTLPNGGTLTAGDDDQVITERSTLEEISLQTQGDIDPTLEAFWVRGGHSVYLNHERIGFVKMDDWEELNVDDLWQAYVEGARAQSEQLNVEVRPLRWVIQPTLDRQGAVAYYALEVQFGNEEPLVNMVVLDFGRYGYEEMTLVQGSASFPVEGAQQMAASIAGAHSFGAQASYFDFQEGDQVAAVGAAGLIAAALGVKFGKGFLFAALLLLKKFWFVLFAIPAILWRWLRGSTREA